MKHLTLPVKPKRYAVKKIDHKALHNLLFVLIAFVAVTASASGLLMITNSDGSAFKIPISILKGTTFEDFLIPGILLTIFVGGTNIMAVSQFLVNNKYKYNWSITGGFILTNWITTQIIIIQTFSWLQLTYFVTGIFIILLSLQLKGKWVL